MAKYADVNTLGRSDEVPYREGESPIDRHYRRLGAALERKREVEHWCRARGIEITVSNHGHHWRFRLPGTKRTAEWWPSSAKLVFDARYKRGVHAHDVVQVQGEIGRRWLAEETSK